MTVLDLNQIERVLVVVAHADDETLMAGATLRTLSSHGSEVKAMSFTDGVSSRPSGSKREINERRESAIGASHELGFTWISQQTYADQLLEREPLIRIAGHIEEAVRDFSPDLLITHSSADLNSDHRRVLEASLVACRPRVDFPITIISGEVASSSHWEAGVAAKPFQPLNLFVDVSSEAWEAKIRALASYKQELRAWPDARSLEALDALSKFRGSTVALRRAEAFEIQRMISG